MKWLLALVIVTTSTPGLERGAGMLCLGAQLAVVHAEAAKLQERSTPKGEWCQRKQTRMPKGAHACGCHKADCTNEDPSLLPAHTDAKCLNFCTVSQCACPDQDCK